jgi:hypothetical protein
MAKKSIFQKIRVTATRNYENIKFATLKFGTDLSGLVPAPKSLLERLGVRKAFVPAGKRPSVRSIIVSGPMMSKARLEAEEGRPLKPAEVKRIRGGKRHMADYLKQKLRFDPRLADRSLYHPDFWNTTKTFQENWMSDQKRFLYLAWERTGIRFELTETGEWVETPVPGAPRKVMSTADWHFYSRHYYSNIELYGPIGTKLMELPPGEVSPPTTRRHVGGPPSKETILRQADRTESRQARRRAA